MQTSSDPEVWEQVKRAENIADDMLGDTVMQVGPFSISDTTTVKELKDIYRANRMKPPAQQYMYEKVKEVCQG